MAELFAWTDGACSGNPGPGGWGVLMRAMDGGTVVKERELAGGEALISLRSRGESLRPFTVVEEMQARAEARYRQTEQALQNRLQATERRLRELRQGTTQ